MQSAKDDVSSRAATTQLSPTSTTSPMLAALSQECTISRILNKKIYDLTYTMGTGVEKCTYAQKCNLWYRLICLSVIITVNILFVFNYYVPNKLLTTPVLIKEYDISQLYQNVEFVYYVYPMYLLIDFFWILFIPESLFIKPPIVLFHHASILLVMYCGRVEILYEKSPPCQIFAALMILTDLCTLTLSLKRLVNLKYKLLYRIASNMFLLSWISLRFIGSPIIGYVIYQAYAHHVALENQLDIDSRYTSNMLDNIQIWLSISQNKIMLALILHVYLSFMNFMNTYELLGRLFTGGAMKLEKVS